MEEAITKKRPFQKSLNPNPHAPKTGDPPKGGGILKKVKFESEKGAGDASKRPPKCLNRDCRGEHLLKDCPITDDKLKKHLLDKRKEKFQKFQAAGSQKE